MCFLVGGGGDRSLMWLGLIEAVSLRWRRLSAPSSFMNDQEINT